MQTSEPNNTAAARTHQRSPRRRFTLIVLLAITLACDGTVGRSAPDGPVSGPPPDLAQIEGSPKDLEHAGDAGQDTAPHCVEVIDGIASIASVTQVSQLTGASSLNATQSVNVYGTDLGSMFLHDDNRIYFVFGDTFGSPGRPGSTAWRSNTMAYTRDFDAADGIKLDGWIVDSSQKAKALVEGSHDANDGTGEVTKIPTYGWSLNGRMYLWIMSVKKWGDPGKWDVNYARLYYSDNDGGSWKPSAVQFPSTSNFVQVAAVQAGQYHYFFGIPAGRFGGVKLARVASSQLLTQSAYRYYDGSGWVASAASAKTLAPAPIGELSLLWNPAMKRWMMTYFNESSACVELRQASSLTGPFDGAALKLACSTDYPQLYGAFTHDKYLAAQGTELYFLTSRWGPYNVFVMRAKLEGRRQQRCD